MKIDQCPQHKTQTAAHNILSGRRSNGNKYFGLGIISKVTAVHHICSPWHISLPLSEHMVPQTPAAGLVITFLSIIKVKAMT